MGHLTLGYSTLYAPPTETIVAAAAGGFKSVGIRITGRRVPDPYTQVINNPSMIREIRHRLDDTGLRLSNVSAYHFYPDLRLSDFVPVIEATAELGARVIVASCYDPDEVRYVEMLADRCQAAAKFGIGLALEFIPYSEARTIDDAYRLVKRAGQPNAGILIDSLHLYRSGSSPMTIKRIEPERICFAQLCDADSDIPGTVEGLRAEAISGRLYPGEGSLPLYQMLDALPGDIEIECEVPNAAHAHLSLSERARRAGDAIRSFLERYHRQRRPTPNAI